MRISTHAPARGATEGAKAYYNVAIISTHAPTGGATKRQGRDNVPYQFQSTLPRGERPTKLTTNVTTAKISIHAPTGGATCISEDCGSCEKFQSTLPRGERRFRKSRSTRSIKFQSTLPRGERHSDGVYVDSYITISIHAPTGGATTEPNIVANPPIVISIHAPTGGATLFQGLFRIFLIISIHAPTGGATISRYRLSYSSGFQSTLPRGERQQKSSNLNSNFCKVVTKIHCFLLFEKLISI